jgi:hypothetical protein
MLKYKIGEIMFKKYLFLTTSIFYILLLVTPMFVFAQAGISILNISDYDVLQGIQIIRGNTTLDNFSSYLVQFSTISHPNDWFNIIESENPVQNDVLAEWDTTIISDGDYHLRLVVLFDNGDLVIKEIHNLQIRNYTAIKISTPTIEITSEITSTPTATLEATIVYPTATTLPKNPAIFTKSIFSRSVLVGSISTFIIITPIAIYQFIKQN